MKGNFTIVREEYNPETYESLVEIHTNLGNFIGTTVADEIDSQYPSIHNGNAIATQKALRKYAKAVISHLKTEYRTMLKLMEYWENDENADYNTIYIMQYRLLNSKRKEIELWEEKLTQVDKSILNRIAARDNLVQKYIAKDKKD